MRESTPRILTGFFPFTGAGYDAPAPVGLSYVVPGDRRAQTVYLRAGNSSDEMVVVVVSRGGQVMRLFPVGAKGGVHVPLAVVEDLEPETRIDVALAAPSGASGTVALDFGLVEI